MNDYKKQVLDSFKSLDINCDDLDVSYLYKSEYFSDINDLLRNHSLVVVVGSKKYGFEVDVGYITISGKLTHIPIIASGGVYHYRGGLLKSFSSEVDSITRIKSIINKFDVKEKLNGFLK